MAIASSRNLIEAAAWQFVLDPETVDPIARQALDATREQATAKPIDKYDAEARLKRLRSAEQLVEIAALDPAERLAAMRARAAAKLVALGLDESQRKQLRRSR
jgi:hypothetical protein